MSELEQIERYQRALRSIAKNTCCGRCQEAALVAQDALGMERAAEESPRQYRMTDQELAGLVWLDAVISDPNAYDYAKDAARTICRLLADQAEELTRLHKRSEA